MAAEPEEDRPDVEAGSATSASGSSHESTGSDASMEIARILADGGDAGQLEGSETPPGLPPSLQRLSPPLPSPPPAIGGASFAESTGTSTGQSRTSSAVSRAAELRHARQQRAQVLSSLQQQYSIVEQNVSRLEQRCAKAEDEALKQRELAAARLDAKVSAEAAAEELRTEVASLHDALLKSEKTLASVREAAAVEAETAQARALQEIARNRSQTEGALESYEAAMAAKSRAEAASARAQASCAAAESSARTLATELTELRRAQERDSEDHQQLLTELVTILSGATDGPHEVTPSRENLLRLAQVAVTGCKRRDEEVIACKLRWERESAALSEQWELASVGMLSRLSTMSHRVGRGERMVTRLTAAAEVLSSSSRPGAPEPEPEPEPEPSAPDRVPQLQAALDKSTAAVRELEQKYLSTFGELEETRRAFHKLHEKYSRAKDMLAHEKRQRRSAERHRQRDGTERTHIHYVIEGPPPSDEDRRFHRPRRPSSNIDDPGSDGGGSQASRSRDTADDDRGAHRESEDDAGSPSVGSVRGEDSCSEEGRFEADHGKHCDHERQQNQYSRRQEQHPYNTRRGERSRHRDNTKPNSGTEVRYEHLYEAHRQHYEERELCRGNYDVAHRRHRTTIDGDARRKHDGLVLHPQPRVVPPPPLGATARVAPAAY